MTEDEIIGKIIDKGIAREIAKSRIENKLFKTIGYCKGIPVISVDGKDERQDEQYEGGELW